MLTHLIPHFDITRFESCLVCFNSPSAVSDEWTAAGIELFHLNIDKRLSIKGVYRLILLLRKWKPDVLLVYGLRANLMARLAAWWCKVPVFITAQQGIEDWKTLVDIFLERYTSSFVDLYVGVSEACCRMLATRERIPARKLYVIPNGIELKVPSDIEERARQIRREHKLPTDSVIIGTVGRLEPVKGHDYLIIAAKTILHNHPNVFFVFLGDDRRDGELQELVKEKDISEKVYFAGYSNEVAAWLKCFDIFVLPSLSEGMPVVVLEAMFMKLPVVATNVGGTGEVVLDGKTGLLVPKADPERLAEAILQLIKNPQQRQELAEAGYKRAREHFTADIMVKRYQDIIIKLLEQKTR